jgi:hypothetical protein
MANVTPGYSFTGSTDPITFTKLNLLAQPTVTIGSGEIVTSMIASGNTYTSPIVASGTPLVESYSTVSFASTIALTFTTGGNTRRIACTSSTACTITATVPAAGYVLRLSFTTDGTAGNVITFSTGFKTLTATPTYTLSTANKYYSIEFVSDGTYLIELNRSGAVG